MKNLTCPDCKNEVATTAEKLRIAFLGGSVECNACGAQLKGGGRLITTIIGAAAGSLLFYVLLYALASSSWLPIVGSLIFIWCLVATSIYFSKFRRVGKRNFHI